MNKKDENDRLGKVEGFSDAWQRIIKKEMARTVSLPRRTDPLTEAEWAAAMRRQARVTDWPIYNGVEDWPPRADQVRIDGMRKRAEAEQKQTKEQKVFDCVDVQKVLAAAVESIGRDILRMHPLDRITYFQHIQKCVGGLLETQLRINDRIGVPDR